MKPIRRSRAERSEEKEDTPTVRSRELHFRVPRPAGCEQSFNLVGNYRRDLERDSAGFILLGKF